jgi:hypothetical protein
MDLPEDIPAVVLDDYRDHPEVFLAAPAPSANIVAETSNDPESSLQEAPRRLTRTSRAIGAGAMGGYPSAQEKRLNPGAQKTPQAAARDARTGGTSTAARLATLRGRLEKNLKSAEEGLNNDLRQLDLKLAGART